jgi:hypothetical protein
MKFVSKLFISTVLLAFLTTSVYAITPNEKNNEVLSYSKTDAWKEYQCDTGITNESLTVKFPCKPFQGYNWGSKVIEANEDFVNYSIEIMNITDLFDSFGDLPVNRNDYATDIEFKMAFLEAYLQENLDDQDFWSEILSHNYSKFLSHNIFLSNGYPTLDAVEIDLEKNTIKKTRLVLTEYAAYELATECKAGLEDQHDFFVNSLQIE